MMNSIQDPTQWERCPFCGSPKAFVFVHSHYQCQQCGNNVMPCCSGETMDPGAVEVFSCPKEPAQGLGK